MSFALYEEARYKEISSHRADHYAKDADEAVKNACIGLAGRNKAICLQEKGATARLQKHDNERNEADLVAQRKSAIWTSVMGFAALIGMGLSAIGVYLVWTTFRATREANEIARDTAKHQLRAYVGFPTIYLHDRWKNDPRFIIEIKNFGQTPAKSVTVHSVISCGPLGCARPAFDVAQEFGTMEPDRLQILIGGFSADNFRVHGEALGSGAMLLHYFGMLTYFDVYGRSYFKEFTAYISHRRLNIGGSDPIGASVYVGDEQEGEPPA